MKDEYDFSNAKRGAIIPLTLDKAKEVIASLQKDLRNQKEAWDQHMAVSVNNARYILELELEIEKLKKK